MYNGKSFYCYRYLHRFSREDLFEKHDLFWNQHEVQKIEMLSNNDNVLSFVNSHYQHNLPYAAYAKFESLIVPINTVAQAAEKSYSMKIHLREACGYTFITIDSKGKTIKNIQCYRGNDAVGHFLKSIIGEKEELAPTMYTIKQLAMTP